MCVVPTQPVCWVNGVTAGGSVNPHQPRLDDVVHIRLLRCIYQAAAPKPRPNQPPITRQPNRHQAVSALPAQPPNNPNQRQRRQHSANHLCIDDFMLWGQ